MVYCTTSVPRSQCSMIYETKLFENSSRHQLVVPIFLRSLKLQAKAAARYSRLIERENSRCCKVRYEVPILPDPANKLVWESTTTLFSIL